MKHWFLTFNPKTSGKDSVYVTPQVLSEMAIVMEEDLLTASVSYRSAVETAGQLNDGYYEEDEIVSVDNVWSD